MIYYEDNDIKLYNGNCLDIMRQIPENSIDLIVTSPPYNVGIKYDAYDDTKTKEEYLSFMLDVFTSFKRILKPDGRFVVNTLYDCNIHNGRRKIRVSLVCEYYHLIRESGLNYKAICDLDEEHPHRVKHTAWGSWLSASCPYPYNPKECVIIGYNEHWKKSKDGTSTITPDEFMEIMGGLWKYKAETRKLTQANFSEDIPIKAIKGFSYIGDVILDPFCGSGTTLIAAIKLRRKAMGIEISKRYCEVTKDRIIMTRSTLL